MCSQLSTFCFLDQLKQFIQCSGQYYLSTPEVLRAQIQKSLFFMEPNLLDNFIQLFTSVYEHVHGAINFSIEYWLFSNPCPNMVKKMCNSLDKAQRILLFCVCLYTKPYNIETMG